MGAIGNDVFDNTEIFIKAIQDLLVNGGGTLLIPAGTYRITKRLDFDCSGNQSISIQGQGRYTSVLNFQNTQGGINFHSYCVVANRLPNFEVKNLGLISSTVASGCAISFAFDSTQNIANTVNVQDVQVSQNLDQWPYGYWTSAISCKNCRNGRIDNLHYYGERDSQEPSASAISLEGECTTFVISRCLILETTTGISVQGSTEGVYVHNTDIVGTVVGIDYSAAQGAEPQLTVSDCHLNCEQVGIRMHNIMQSTISNSLFYANSWFPSAMMSDSWTGIHQQGDLSNYNKIVGCTFTTEPARQQQNLVGIDMVAGNWCMISNNIIFGLPDVPLSVGIQVSPMCAGVVVCNNIVNCTQTPYILNVLSATTPHVPWWKKLWNSVLSLVD